MPPLGVVVMTQRADVAGSKGTVVGIAMIKGPHIPFRGREVDGEARIDALSKGAAKLSVWALRFGKAAGHCRLSIIQSVRH